MSPRARSDRTLALWAWEGHAALPCSRSVEPGNAGRIAPCPNRLKLCWCQSIVSFSPVFKSYLGSYPRRRRAFSRDGTRMEMSGNGDSQNVISEVLQDN